MVEWIFRRTQSLEPSDAYKILVLLAEAGGIDAVITTNFDLMLETAQAQLGRNIFQVFAQGIARPYLPLDSRFDPPKKPYLKLHGDIASRSVTLVSGDSARFGFLPDFFSKLTTFLSHGWQIRAWRGQLM